MKNCTGERCLIQYDKVDPATCKAVGYCPQATPPRTRADRIRAMTDEELASIIMKYVDCNLCRVERGHCDKDYAECKGAWLDWLRQEA